MNECTFIGNITKDIKLEATSNGIEFIRFDIAVTRNIPNQDGSFETDFVKCVAWRDTAKNIAKYFKKGSKIAINGSLQTRNYEVDKIKKTITEIVVRRFDFCQSTNKKEEEPLQEVDDSDLPF